VKAAEPVAGDAHVAHDDRVVRQRGPERLEEGARLGLLGGEPVADALVELAHAPLERVEAAALAEPVCQCGGRLTRVGLHDYVRAVVLRGIGRIDVDSDQVRRLRLLPALGHHGVEIAADRDDQVGLVPESAGLGHMRRALDEAGVAGREEPLRGEREDDRRDEPLGEPPDRLAGARLKRAAARPDERPPRPVQEGERAVELTGVGWRGGRRRSHRQGVRPHICA
jgi:hypothetical protein